MTKMVQNVLQRNILGHIHLHLIGKKIVFSVARLALKIRNILIVTKMRMATTIPFKERLRFACQKRDDEWGEEVRRRITNCNDLVAVEARYHISCNEGFLVKHSTFKTPSGRPTDSDCLENFELVCEWLEAEGELCSLSEVHDKMTEIATLNESDRKPIFPEMVKNKTPAKIQRPHIFAEVNGKSNVICFREMVNYLVTDALYNA